MKSGFVPVVGRPNVGKSTLVNKLVGSKVSITSSRPQTTRNVIRGVVNGPTRTIRHIKSFSSTHRASQTEDRSRRPLECSGLRDAWRGGCGHVHDRRFDADRPRRPADRRASKDRRFGSGAWLSTRSTGQARGEVIEQLAKAGEWDFASYVPVSAIEGTGLDALVDEIVERLPDGPRYYPPGMTTDQPESLVIGEIVREVPRAPERRVAPLVVGEGPGVGAATMTA